MTTFTQTTHPVADFLAHTRLAPRQAHKALTIWPLQLRDEAVRPGASVYVSLGTALAKGTLEISEVDAGGSVPHVRATNKGGEAVLFVFGEEIRGAKQNRVANASFLVPPQRSVVLDVSCVEAGRWQRRSARFEHAEEVLSSAIRRKMARKVSRSIVEQRGFKADQGEVWAEIGSRLGASATLSDTGAYADYRGSRDTDLGEVAKAFHPVERQVGFVACIGDQVVGLEGIGRPEVFQADFQALLNSYAIDAIDAVMLRQLESQPAAKGSFDAPEPFLEAVGRATFSSSSSLGDGDDLRLESGSVGGCALVCGDLVHVTAFPA